MTTGRGKFMRAALASVGLLLELPLLLPFIVGWLLTGVILRLHRLAHPDGEVAGLIGTIESHVAGEAPSQLPERDRV